METADNWTWKIILEEEKNYKKQKRKKKKKKKRKFMALIYRHNAMMSNMIKIDHIEAFEHNKYASLKEVCKFAQVIQPTVSGYL